MASKVVSDNFETSSGAVPELGGTGATTCKAWVNFDAYSGTPTIRDSFNVSSITDSGVGYYRVNYTNNMPNRGYSAQVTGTGAQTSGGYAVLDSVDLGGAGDLNGCEVHRLTIRAITNANAQDDHPVISVTVFSN